MLTLLDFYANWCAPCNAMKPVLEEVEKDLEGKITVERVNVDENSQKAQKYGVMSIPTFVLVKDGEEVDRKIGAMNKEQFEAWVKSHI